LAFIFILECAVRPTGSLYEQKLWERWRERQRRFELSEIERRNRGCRAAADNLLRGFGTHRQLEDATGPLDDVKGAARGKSVRLSQSRS
jgi:hypothetical protein